MSENWMEFSRKFWRRQEKSANRVVNISIISKMRQEDYLATVILELYHDANFLSTSFKRGDIIKADLLFAFYYRFSFPSSVLSLLDFFAEKYNVCE